MPEDQVLTTETAANGQGEHEQVAPKTPEGDLISREEVENLVKALKSERETRKTYEKELREKASQLEKFADINPQEYRKMLEEAAIAERERLAAEERTQLLEEKYGSQARDANKKAEEAQIQLQEFRKRYALEKVFFAAGGRTDADGGVSFFDLLADRLGNNFRLESNGSVTVIDNNGDPILDNDTGRRIAPEDYLSTFKDHPIYGTFFKSYKGSGAGIGLGGTDTRGINAEDFTNLSSEEMFERAFSS